MTPPWSWHSRIVGAGVALALGLAGSTAGAQSFTLLSQYSVFGLSGDGVTAVGNDPEGRSFAWTAEGGATTFGNTPPFGPVSSARAVSRTGRFIAGWNQPSSGRSNAYMWSGVGGYQSLGSLAGTDHSYPTAVSADGAVVVGTADAAFGTLHRAFIWTQGGGLRPLPGLGSQTGARAASDDGSVVAGWRSSGGRTFAYVWTAGSGPQGLPSLFADGNCDARGMNGDGSIIVGTSYTADVRPTASLWRNGAVISLGQLDGFASSFATDVSDDGSVVVGLASTVEGLHEAFVWTEGAGMRSMRSYLESFGVGVPSWVTLDDRPMVSGDGRTFAGTASATYPNGGGFVATIPGPGAICLGPAAGLLAVCRRRRR